ncbi:MAG TPA: D-xylose ABC transporter substrate-binding protein, partial [Oxalobacteraceae bacterium]|nr:D-xylose ABC transporter substrate-binding protein [Oxalobacteraceae bacterium]
MAKESRGKAPLVGVSWSNFQEERWKRDEAAITKVLAKYGAEYISADAEASNDKQMRDIDTLVARGAKAIIVLAWDADAILPAIERAKQHGVAIIAYDRLIQSRNVFYITFDNVEVGRIQAREILKRQPQGDYAFIKGAATDPNSTMLYKGQMEVLDSALRRGDIRNVGDQFTEGWKPENAR